jgi:hypothetical protein
MALPQRPPLRRPPTSNAPRTRIACVDSASLLRPFLSCLENESAAMAPILLGNERAVHRLRVVLLALWASVLTLLQPALESYAMRLDVAVVYQTVSRILVRPEFGPHHLLLDAQGRPACDAHTLANARRYRRMLRATHCFVVEQLGIATQLSSTQPFTLFAVRTLVVSYFRVPGAATELVARSRSRRRARANARRRQTLGAPAAVVACVAQSHHVASVTVCRLASPQSSHIDFSTSYHLPSSTIVTTPPPPPRQQAAPWLGRRLDHDCRLALWTRLQARVCDAFSANRPTAFRRCTCGRAFTSR